MDLKGRSAVGWRVVNGRRMRLLKEADKMFPDEPLGRGEYRIARPHILICCPSCGGVSNFYGRAFDGQFKCSNCGLEEPVKLTGERR